ncbi:MAG: peptidoglycan-binding protein, partial [Alphaproteobacteria bacterium]|nr:peptidoglycan-binding protein [Alphaproteobacteria bacterium]
GQFTHTPYWKCLQIEKTNPKMSEQARDWFDSMSVEDRVTFIQRKLAGLGVYNGPVNGQSDPQFTNAVAVYQAQNQLIADGRLNFDTYYSLLDDDHPAAAGGAQQAALVMPKPVVAPLTVALTSSKPVYKAGEVLDASVAISHDAFLYCFYDDGLGHIARLYPNRYQSADPLVRSRSLQVSAANQAVKIRFDSPGARERVACYGSDSDFILSAELKEKELVPLPMKTLSELAGALRKSNPALIESVLEVSVQ